MENHQKSRALLGPFKFIMLHASTIALLLSLLGLIPSGQSQDSLHGELFLLTGKNGNFLRVDDHKRLRINDNVHLLSYKKVKF